ncbi:MAG: sugar transferase [Planctomycetaceae bacterium]|nr:sugar transferase [Planctomycetaceae bacterium]
MPEPVTLLGFGGTAAVLTVHLARRYFSLTKDIVDVLLGVILLILALPVLAACCVIIKVCSRGPAFFTQVRMGRDGRLFRMYKLRTMHVDAEKGTGAVWAGHGDPRVISPCRWMRLSHVDELPQLVNVIKGDMSLVGPRPERPEIMAELRKHYPEVDRRLEVRPGITGLAQIRSGYDTSIEAFRRKLTADLEYIERRHWGMEFSIMLRTFSKFRDSTAR